MSSIVITYDGTDITDSVMFGSASFESQLGAMPGQFSFTCKDPTQTLSFVTGKTVQVHINGALYYGGYLLQVSKRFAFPADDTSGGASNIKTRLWELRGSDFNFIFDRRVLYNKASPTSKLDPVTGHPSDAAVVTYMCTNYLDLSDFDFSTHVSVVSSDVVPDTGRYGFIGVGTIWRNEMKAVADRAGAMYYIDGNKKLWYMDRETATPGWGFSDEPDGVTTFGFRDFEYVTDASNMVNDALVWGGSQYTVTGATATLNFGRATDSTSISTYFRSQLAEMHINDLASDTACHDRANIIVYGDPGGIVTDPSTNRGLQNPQRTIRLSWFEGGVPSPLLPGVVISTYLNSFGETITLPVRNIRISFPNLHPDGTPIVKFDALFSVQTDDPFTLWKYMKKIADQGGTAATATAPVSDGSAAAVLLGTEVCMVPTGSINSSNVTFTLRDPYADASLRVWLNGLLQRPGVDYNESSPSTGVFTFSDAPLSGDQLWVCYTSA